MKKTYWLAFTLGLGLHLSGKGQSTKGLTGVTDTSYNNYSALKNTQKTHPQALLVTEITNNQVKEQRNITYIQAGNRALQLDVFYPKKIAKKGYPCLLIIHGGGWRSGNRSQHIPLAQKLASLGYVTVTAEYRLSTEALYPAAVHDLKAALRWIRTQAKTYSIDTNRVATVGFSAGGQLATLLGNTNGMPSFEGNLGLNEHSSKVHAIVDIDGIVAYIHPESGEGDDTRSTSAATYWFGYSKAENPALWNEASALTYAGQNTPPTLFLNSSVSRMHAGRDDYRKKLAAYNVYSEVQTFADAPHSFCLFSPWFEPTVQHIDTFLKKVFQKKTP